MPPRSSGQMCLKWYFITGFYKLANLLLCFPLLCRYYGLSVWFPDQIKHLQYEEYESKTKIFNKDKIEHFHFNFSLKNQIHTEGHYIRDWYVGFFPFYLSIG